MGTSGANGGGDTAETFATAYPTTGSNGGNVGLAGSTGLGGAGGAMGSVTLTGSSVAVNKTIGNTTLGAAFSTSGFTGSAYKDDSVFGGNITISSSGSGNVSLVGSVAAINGTVNVTSPTTIGINGIDNTSGSTMTLQSTGTFIASSTATNSFTSSTL